MENNAAVSAATRLTGSIGPTEGFAVLIALVLLNHFNTWVKEFYRAPSSGQSFKTSYDSSLAICQMTEHCVFSFSSKLPNESIGADELFGGVN